MESQKVRSMYETDTSMDWKNGRFAAASNCQSMAGQPAIGSSELYVIHRHPNRNKTNTNIKKTGR
jgi:hypothetical protein